MKKNKLKRLQLAARILRMNDGYKGKKDSNHKSRFSFWFDKDYPSIEVFNADKKNDLFLWEEECVAIMKALNLSGYFTTADYPYDRKRLVYRIY